MKQMRIYGTICLLVLLTPLFVACASHHVKPEAQKVNPDHIPAFKSTKTFKVVNNQLSKENMAVGKSAIGTFYVDKHTFTAETARLLTEELAKHGMTPAEDGDMVINLAITDINLSVGFSYNCTMKMDVDTNNGYAYPIEANNVSPNGGRVWGGAVTKMVEELLNDDAFIEALTK